LARLAQEGVVRRSAGRRRFGFGELGAHRSLMRWNRPIGDPAFAFARDRNCPAGGESGYDGGVTRGGPLSFYEFFCGGGMARLGLGERWSCAFANDFDPVTAATYRANFPDAAEHLREGDVHALTAA